MSAKAARRAVRLGVAVAVVSFFTSCQQSPRALVGPTGASAGSQAQQPSENSWGSSRTHGDKHAASNESDFFCGLGPYGAADSSHATMSASGNETVVCTGKTEANPDRAEKIEGFPCLLHFGDGDPGTEDITFDSRAVVTPSGHVTLVCKS
jgi:hypothetical protein